MNRVIIKVVLLLLISVQGLAACSNRSAEHSELQESAKKTDQQHLTERSQARWDAIIAGEYGKAYEYETPSYRAVNDLTHYKLQFGGQVSRKAVEIAKVVIDENDPTLAIVTIKIDFKATVGGQTIESHTFTPETWRKTDGQWWHLSKQ